MKNKILPLEDTMQLRSVLHNAQQNGKPWVAFNDQFDENPRASDLRFFDTAGEAGDFCDEANGPDTYEDQIFNWDNYIYLPVDSMLANLQIDGTKVVRIPIDMDDIAWQMNEKAIHLPYAHTIDLLEGSLSQGLLHPVTLQWKIAPLQEIADYSVISHQHDGGMIYETGHSCKIMGVYRTYKEAREFLDDAVLYNELGDKGRDYLLLGRFHNQSIQLDQEGYIAPHAGLTLMTAHHNYGNGHEYHELQDLHAPAIRMQYFFMGLDNRRLTFFNHKLEPTTLDAMQVPFYPNNYHHVFIINKNLKTMNQASYEYNRTQLINLGFGEEIAKPLLEKMDQNLAEFTLEHVRKFDKDEVHSTLHFSKGDDMEKDLTFFNRFDATLKQAGKEDLTQTFFVGQKFNYTLQERFNMMVGRAVYREQPVMKESETETGKKFVPTGETYLAWRALDFKNADQYGNFLPKTIRWHDHAKELDCYPILGMEENYLKQRLINQLQKGNQVNVTVQKDGLEVNAKVMVNGAMLRLDFLDENGQKLDIKKGKVQAIGQTQAAELSPQEVQRAAKERAAEQKQANDVPTTQGQEKNESQQKKETEQINAGQKQETRRGQGVRVR